MKINSILKELIRIDCYSVVKNAVYIETLDSYLSFETIKKISEVFKTSEIDIRCTDDRGFLGVDIYGIDGSKYE